MRDGVQSRGHFLERLLFVQGGEDGKQGPVQGVEGWLALQKWAERKQKYNIYLLNYLFSKWSLGKLTNVP